MSILQIKSSLFEKGPQGLLTGKKATIFAARGGEYAASGNDWQAEFVRAILGFVGITDVQFPKARSALRRLVPDNRQAA